MKPLKNGEKIRVHAPSQAHLPGLVDGCLHIFLGLHFSEDFDHGLGDVTWGPGEPMDDPISMVVLQSLYEFMEYRS